MVTDTGLMIGQREIQWANIKPIFGQWFVFFWEAEGEQLLAECWFNVGPAPKTMAQQ